MRERGNKNEIVVSPGRELDHRYTLMTEHVCPVGALTSRDFRFKARVWFLRAQKSVCSGCATGCNSFMDYDPRDNRVYRLRPRDNAQVNKFWMCDDGMLTYRAIHENRLERGALRNGGTQETSAAQAVAIAASTLASVPGDRVAFVLSAQASNEDNFAMVRFAQALGSDKLYLAALGGWQGDDILRSSDNNPNRRGALQMAGQTLLPLAALLPILGKDEVDAVLVLGSVTAEDSTALAPLRTVTTIALSSHKGPLTAAASIALPVAAHGEIAGTFVNQKGTAQRFEAAIHPPEGIAPAWSTLGALARAMGKDLGFHTLAELRAKMPGADATRQEARA
jgi:NADH-quinone oxidoreductase subunit G